MKPHYHRILDWAYVDKEAYKRAHKPVPIVLIWFKRKWRKVLKVEPNERIGKDSFGNYREGLITFEGMSVPRRINAGVCSFVDWETEAIRRAIDQEQYWFQRNGPQFAELNDWWLMREHQLDPVDFRSPPKVIPND